MSLEIICSLAGQVTRDLAQTLTIWPGFTGPNMSKIINKVNVSLCPVCTTRMLVRICYVENHIQYDVVDSNPLHSAIIQRKATQVKSWWSFETSSNMSPYPPCDTNTTNQPLNLSPGWAADKTAIHNPIIFWRYPANKTLCH